MSDTHGNEPAIDAAIERLGEVDAYIHLGDHASDSERIAASTGKPVHAVRGNCDAFSSKYPRELCLELEGAKLLLIHGHAHEVDAYSTYSARMRAIELGCCALLYGHTHIPQLVHRDGIIVLNPGSPSIPRGGFKSTCAVVEIEDGRVRAKVIPV